MEQRHHLSAVMGRKIHGKIIHVLVSGLLFIAIEICDNICCGCRRRENPLVVQKLLCTVELLICSKGIMGFIVQTPSL